MKVIRLLLVLLNTFFFIRAHEVTRTQERNWLFCVYIAARNDLHPFSKLNMNQMSSVGSHDQNLAIVVQWDEPGKRGTQRYLVEKGRLVPFHSDTSSNSGDPENLISFCSWAIETFPAKHRALILWDHGTGGSLDPYLARSFPFARLLNLQTTDKKPTKEKIAHPLTVAEFFKDRRGICFDDAYRTYINNQALDYALGTLARGVLAGSKWDIVGFDACLMADLSTLSIVKKYATYMVASEDVEPGTGWNYRTVLAPIAEQYMDPAGFAQHIVSAYGQTYSYLTPDFTQSAVKLDEMEQLERNIHEIALLLVQGMQLQEGRAVRSAIELSCFKNLCTNFDEPDYKDLAHFLMNLQKNLSLFAFIDQEKGASIKEQLDRKAAESLTIISRSVIANCVGKNLSNAKGISIYFPERRIHSSFPRTTFALSNAWYHFLKQYLTP